MDKPKSSYVSEILLLIAVAVSILLPGKILPFGLIIVGGCFLTYTIYHSIRSHVRIKARFGPMTAATFFLIFGIGMLAFPDQVLLAFVSAIMMGFIIQMVWMAWKNKKPE